MPALVQPEVTSPALIRRDVSPVPGTGSMFCVWGLLTGSDVGMTSPEAALTGRMFCACQAFYRVFFVAVVQNVVQ